MKIVLYSSDINLIARWQKLLEAKYQIFMIDNEKDLLELKDSVLILSTCVNLKDKSFIISTILNNNNKILVLERTPEINSAKQWLALGINGYGNSLMTSSYMNSAVEYILNNYIWLIPQITTQLVQTISSKKEDKKENEEVFSSLTNSEKKVALLLKDGYSNQNISEHLKISINTVKSHIKKIYEKLNITDRISFSNLFSK